MQLLVALQDLFHPLSCLVMRLAYYGRIEDARGRFQRIDRWIDAQLRDLSAQHRGGIEVCEGGGRGRVGQIVCRHIDCLHGSDGTSAGGGDALLHGAHLRGQGRLIADGGGHTSQEGGHLRAGLCKAKDIINEKKNVSLFSLRCAVPKGFRHRQSGERHGGTCAGWLVHLSENQGGL